jgi:hypothetical protein
MMYLASCHTQYYSSNSSNHAIYLPLHLPTAAAHVLITRARSSKPLRYHHVPFFSSRFACPRIPWVRRVLSVIIISLPPMSLEPFSSFITCVFISLSWKLWQSRYVPSSRNGFHGRYGLSVRSVCNITL